MAAYTKLRSAGLGRRLKENMGHDGERSLKGRLAPIEREWKRNVEFRQDGQVGLQAQGRPAKVQGACPLLLLQMPAQLPASSTWIPLLLQPGPMRVPSAMSARLLLPASESPTPLYASPSYRSFR